MPRADFLMAPGLLLSVSGGGADVRHFFGEYGACQVEESVGHAPSLEVTFVRRIDGLGSAQVVQGGHKTVGWQVALSDAGDRPVRAQIAMRGAPARFARSLVQGYYVEPLLSVLAADLGLVQLPAAGVVDRRGLHILLGRSRAGKSTLATRALAAGGQSFGDDQVFVSSAGEWRPFPRRLRLYPDIRETAPGAWRRLRRSTWLALTGLRLLGAATRGFVRPSLGVVVAELGGRWDPGPRTAIRAVLLERSRDVASVESQPADSGDAIRWAHELLSQQRARIARVNDPGWASRLAVATDREAGILASAFAGVPIERLRIPDRWSARHSIEAAADALGLER